MSQSHHGPDAVTPGSEPPPQRTALPLRTIPEFAIPTGATSPIPSVLVETIRTTYTWQPPAQSSQSFVWQRPEEPPAA